MAVDYFLKLDGVDGEAEDAAHSKEIQLDSWDWSEAQTGSFASGGGGGSGKVKMEDFEFTCKIGTHSPKLMVKCASGEHVKKGTLTARKAGKTPQDFLKVNFTDLLISSYSVGGSTNDEGLPNDKCKFNFAKIEFQYRAQKADGSLDGPITATYDLKKSQAS